MSKTAVSIINLEYRGGMNQELIETDRCRIFLDYTRWVDKYLKIRTKSSYLVAKQKQREIICEIKSNRAWGKFSEQIQERI